MASVIQTLGPSAYGGFMELVGDGADATTHKALVHFYDTDSAVDSYVKIYCAKVAPKGLVNELVGYALAKAGGLLTPPRAAVLLLDSEQTQFLPSGVEPLRNAEGHVVSWCVQSLGGHTPKQSYQLSVEKAAALTAILQDLRKWSEFPDVATLDAWLLNEDRNLGNLVRIRAGRYAIIDHGRALTGNSWVSPLDRRRMKHRNVLAEVLWNDPDLENAPKPYHLPLVNSFDRHERALQEALADLNYWLPLLVSSADECDVMQFIAERVASVRKYLMTTYGVLIL